jgi:hypothetical protein
METAAVHEEWVEANNGEVRVYVGQVCGGAGWCDVS